MYHALAGDVSLCVRPAPAVLAWKSMGGRWGIAVVEHGRVVGVSGHYLLKRQAEREIGQLVASTEPIAGVVFRPTRRSSSRSADWGITVDDIRATPPGQST